MKKPALISTYAHGMRLFLSTFFLLCFALLFTVLFTGVDAARCDESENAGTTAFPFLRVGQGTRAAAMGGAYAAVAEDASCLYWNPGCVSGLATSEVELDYFSYIADVQAGGFSFIPVLGIPGRLGFAMYFFSYGSIQRVDAQRTFDGTFSPLDMFSVIGYSLAVREDLLVGSSGKIVFSSIDEYSALGLCLDFGVLHHSRIEGVDFGLVLRNLGYQVKAYVEEKNMLPLTLAFGLAYRTPSFPILLCFEVDRPVDYGWMFKVGGEGRISDILALRAGYSTQGSDWKTGLDSDSLAGFSAGFGILLDQYGIDYAYVPHGGLGDVHRISLRIRY